ncbi:MAG: AAA family ATPase, partial [Flavobacteriaceae bacterium]|nr:AAA family ATPase [Flavobacteriaceae bacterium]
MAQRKANFKKENLLRKVEEPKGKSPKKKFVYDPNNDPFILRTANERTEYAKNLAVPSMLMSELLFENTVTMLFAETGLGKSLLAVQIVDALSRGKSILGLENEAEPLTTLYVDMENGESVHRARYSDFAKDDKGKKYFFDEYQWSDNCHFLDLATADKYSVPKKDAIDWWFDLITYK